MDIQRLKEARKARGYRQEDLADKIGVARSTYASYEQGSKKPNHEVLVRLGQILGHSTDYLLGASPVSSETSGLINLASVDATSADAEPTEPTSAPGDTLGAFLEIARRLTSTLEQQNFALHKMAAAQAIDAQARLELARASTIDAETRSKDAEARSRTSEAMRQLSESQVVAQSTIDRVMAYAMGPHDGSREPSGATAQAAVGHR